MILAHDIGTSGLKSTVYTPDGTLLASVTSSYPLFYGNEFEVEQNPNDWWNALCHNTQNIIEKVNKDDIKCVSFSGQMMGVVAVGENGEVLRNSIIWADQRAYRESEKLLDRFSSDWLYRLTGNPTTPSYSAPKIWWFKENEPHLYEKTVCFLQAKDFLILKLTGEFVTDYSDASGTGMFDLNEKVWMKEILDFMGIPEEKLPMVCASTDCIGTITHQAAIECGLLPGTKVIAGGADGSCAAMGAGVIEDEELFSYLGSSAWVASASAQPIFEREQRTFNFIHVDKEKFMPIGTMQSAGTSFEWIRSITASNQPNSLQWMNEQAERSPIGSNRLFFLPYLIGERSPIWDKHAKGAFIGLTPQHDAGHMIRAVMEGVALNLTWIYKCLAEQKTFRELWFFGGGANSKLWQQMLADMTGLPLKVPRLKDEITGMGAAIAGAVAIGELSQLADAKSWIQLEQIIEPDEKHFSVYQEKLAEMKQLYVALKPHFHLKVMDQHR
ncbi:xylulokinase [Bacillus sp. FJAT-50079]|uniref:xylulokinase n=1 Tax=Bacillus sp. FJAT-50079 TaxID=2833577 RepID=UPI001BCA5E23|nr:xylulokinase [Bacillus sp. FJAT-50079]MBS4207980.1 xylulokinase [Bacillus sp. FJAT-50079]